MEMKLIKSMKISNTQKLKQGNNLVINNNEPTKEIKIANLGSSNSNQEESE